MLCARFTGALGINNAKIDNYERYIRAYCSDEDDSEQEWLYWMAGSTSAAILFCIFATVTLSVGGYLCSSSKPNSAQTEMETLGSHSASHQSKSKPPKYIGERSDKCTVRVKNQKKEKPLQKMTPGAVIAVFLTMALLSIVLPLRKY